MFCANNYHKSAFDVLKWAKIGDLGTKNSTFTSECLKCINMHQSASKCVPNELCKGFVHEIIKELVLMTSKGAKINEIPSGPIMGNKGPTISNEKRPRK